VRPEFGSPAEHGDLEILNLHRYLIGLRRRHPWLHQARTTALSLDNTRYVYESRCGDDALIIALNLGDEVMGVPVAELTGRTAEIIAGTAAPPREVVSRAEVPANGWLVLSPG
jgi:glycosidase